jgi:hypothetical protein
VIQEFAAKQIEFRYKDYKKETLSKKQADLDVIMELLFKASDQIEEMQKLLVDYAKA